VEFGGIPGSAVLLDSDHMTARFPQASTHKLSLGLLAKLAEANGTTKAWLLGVQPDSLRPGAGLTPAVRGTLELLLDLLAGCLRTACLGGRASSRALTAGTDEGCLGSRGRSPSQRAEVMA
jgi:Ni,Fe-hydrogenase maturation factor